MRKDSQVNQVNNDVYYGIIPILHKERIYGFWDILLVTGAWAIATWCYVQGGYIATLVGVKEAITSTLFGMTFSGLILCLAVLIPTRYGIDLWVYQRALFGYLGVVVMAVLAIMASFGYEAVNADLYANSITLLLDSAGIPVGEAWKPWIASTCIIFGGWIALRGPIAVKRATQIMVPSLMLVGVVIIFLVFRSYSFSELAAIKPLYPDAYGGPFENYMMVMEWNIAFIFAWFAALGVLARLVRNERTSYWGHVGGFSVIMAIFICIGALTALAMVAATGKESVDPTEWLIELGGPTLGILSLIFIGVANVTTQAVALYSFTVSTKIIKPDWNYKKVAIFWSVWCIVLLFWGRVFEYYSVFLAVVGATSGPMIALLLTDFYLVRKQRFSLKAIFQIKGNNAYKYTGGFNIPVLIAYGLGLYSYFLVYDPINYVIKSDIFLYTTATGLSMIVSAGVYYILSLFKPINQYLRKDVMDQEVQLEQSSDPSIHQ
ncbi:purine-cytosine permease family protein [Ammoniphilus resinae]|uniref:NCS1 family nucleobase:cation symporter-1 n=1 Tax=Ammoniphilus resinae TaxID=861532 RepID=A0ABS4GSY4_9BACL|nr:cytosine permease [Ammoniphilus resinae]MBP1933359.1 NCS1 family nucleobase:cation symporter-1 [Ammoniphilus resinae]